MSALCIQPVVVATTLLVVFDSAAPRLRRGLVPIPRPRRPRTFVGRRAADPLDAPPKTSAGRRPFAGKGWSSPIAFGRPDLSDHRRPDGTHPLLARALPRCVERQNRLGRHGLRQPGPQRGATDSLQELARQPDSHHRWRPRLRPLWRTRNGLPDDRGNDRVEDPRDQVSAAAWQRRIAGPGRRSARLQLRRLRRAVRRGARRGNRQAPLEERAACLR